MIARHCFEREWITRQRSRFPGADPQLIERQIRAFALLDLLAQSDIRFVFKGGTALVLLLGNARRLSIDIDIVSDCTIEQLRPLADGSVFTGIAEVVRKESPIPKRHYRYTYVSVIDGTEKFVFLDVLDAEPPYPHLIAVPIRNNLLEVDRHVMVTMPDLNGLAGDKLTAFAPRTLGIPFGAGKSMEIVKQLFDLGALFERIDNLALVSETYTRVWAQQSSFLGYTGSPIETLDDTRDAAFLLSQAEFRMSVSTPGLDEMLNGIRQISGYLLGIEFTKREARIAASRVALLATLIRRKRLGTSMEEYRFSSDAYAKIAGRQLVDRFRILNKLGTIAPEAFLHWCRIAQMENES
jgi:hypothetical protein